MSTNIAQESLSSDEDNNEASSTSEIEQKNKLMSSHDKTPESSEEGPNHQLEATPLQDNGQSPQTEESNTVKVDLSMDDERKPGKKCCCVLGCSSCSSSQNENEEEFVVHTSNDIKELPLSDADSLVTITLEDLCVACDRTTTSKTGPIMKPCKCKCKNALGGEYTIHRECLRKEIKESQNNDFKCSKCSSKYNVEIYRNSVWNDFCSQGFLAINIIIFGFLFLFNLMDYFTSLVPNLIFIFWGIFTVVLYFMEFYAFILKRKRISDFVVLPKKQNC